MEKKKKVNNCNETKQQASQQILYAKNSSTSTKICCLAENMVGFLVAGKKNLFHLLNQVLKKF